MPLLTGLTAYYLMEEASGWAGDSAGGYHLVDQGGPGTYAGHFGNGRTFNGGGQYLDSSNSIFAVGGNIDFTWSAWVYLSTTGNDIPSVVCRWGGTHGEYVFSFYTPAMVWLLQVIRPDTTTASVASAGTYPFEAWYHVMMWHDSVNDELGISVNGVEDTVAHSDGIYDATPEAAGFAIGRLGGNGYGDVYWAGVIDEVGYWRRMLTPEERAALYNSGAGLQYPFDDEPEPGVGRRFFLA